MKNLNSILCMLLFSFTISSVKSQPFVIDTTFGASGLIGGSHQTWCNHAPSDIILQNDCKAVVSATANGPAGESYISITRYDLSTGTLDTSFNTNGEAFVGFNFRSPVSGMALQADGKIIVAGSDWDSNSSASYRGAAFRFNANGTVDSTFGTNGRAKIDYDGVSSGHFTTPLIQNDGKIVLTGTTSANVSGGSYGFVAVRLDTMGMLDTSFSGDGLYRNLLLYAGGNDAELLPNGQILAVNTDEFPGLELNFILLNPNGVADSSFGTDGVKYSGFSNIQHKAVELVMQTDGKFVMVFKASALGHDFNMVRFKSDLTVDSAFAVNGVLYMDFPTINAPEVGSLALQKDGKLLFSITKSTGTEAFFTMVRINPNGTMDGSFGIAGVLQHPFDPSSDIVNAIVDDNNTIWSSGRNQSGAVILSKITQYPGELIHVAVNQAGNTLVTSAYGSYQWYKDGILLTGETDSILTITGDGSYVVEVTSGGCTDASTPVIITSINESIHKFPIHIYPNPFKDFTTVSLGDSFDLSNATLKIYDAYGKLAYHMNNINNSTIKINKGNLSAGIYHLEVSSDQQTAGCGKLVVF